jgi:hypothetical protein
LEVALSGRIRTTVLLAGLVALAAISLSVNAEPYTLTLKDHRFEPTRLVVPAGTRIKLIVKNLDPTAEEFESYELNREKVIPGGSVAAIYIGPLKPGEYPFFGEFHADSATGTIVAE